MQIKISLLIRLDALIRKKATGSPKELACKLNVSLRTVHNYLSYLREDLQLDVYYDYHRLSYCYGGDREFIIHLGTKNNKQGVI